MWYISLTWEYYYLLWVVWKLPNSVQDRPSQLVNNIIFRPFFFSFRPMALVSYFFLSRSEVRQPRICTLLSCLSIDSSLYHVIFSHVTVFSVFFGKSIFELCDPQCEFWVLLSKPIRLSTNSMTLIPILTFTKLWVVSVEHLQRVWHASSERLPFRTPGSVTLFGTCLCSNFWVQIPRTCHVFIRLFTLNTPWYILYSVQLIVYDS